MHFVLIPVGLHGCGVSQVRCQKLRVTQWVWSPLSTWVQSREGSAWTLRYGFCVPTISLGQLGLGSCRHRAGPGAEQVRRCIFLGRGPTQLSGSKQLQVATKHELNGLVSRAGGSRSCYRPWASRPQPDPGVSFQALRSAPQGVGNVIQPHPSPYSSPSGSLALQRNQLFCPLLPNPGPCALPGVASMCCLPTMRPATQLQIHPCRILMLTYEEGLFYSPVYR